MAMGKVIIGIDEAGRGAVIGPLVVAGVSIDGKDVPDLEKLKLKDSKELSAKRREYFYKKIEEIAKDIIVIKISPCKIDNHKKEGINLNKLESMKFVDIIDYLDGNEAYVDCPDVNTKTIENFLKNGTRGSVKFIVEHKADVKYPIVSAASIIAKVERDADIEEIKKKYGDIGPGYSSNDITIKWMENWIKNNKEWPDIVRKSWDTSKRIKGDNIQSKLKSFFKIKKEGDC